MNFRVPILLSFLLLAALPARAEGPIRGCDLLLAKEKELAYFQAETPAERRKAQEALYEWIEEIRANGEREVSTDTFTAAWWRVAFARKVGPIPFPGQMEMSEIQALLKGTDAPVYLDAMRSAYRINEFRLRTSLFFDRAGETILDTLRRAGKWSSRQVSAIVPDSLRARAEALLEKFRTQPRVRRVSARAGRTTRWLRDGIARVPSLLQTDAAVGNAARARTITLYAGLKLRSALISGIDFIFPIHLRTFLPEKWLEQTLPIFTKLEKDPHFIPQGEELATLRRYGAEEAFEKRRTLLLRHPRWFKTLRIGSTTHRWVIAGMGVSAIAAAVLQARDGGPVSLDEFLRDPKNALLPNQIQLISETVPFPHLALRIGDRVYSYGYTHMTVSSVEDYLRSHQPKGDGSGSFFERQRSVEVVTINLSPEETARMRKHFDDLDGKAYDFEAIQADMNPEYVKLRRQLSLQENKEYKNITFVNDCATMVVRALKQETSLEIPQFIDPSPSSVIMYFGMEKALGSNKRVESVRLVLGSKAQNPTLQLLRNAYINAREARLFYSPVSLAINEARRAYFEVTTSKKDLQHFDPAFLEKQKAKFDDVDAEIREDDDLKHYLANSKRIATDPAFAAEAKKYFARVYDDGLRTLESSDAPLDQLIGSFYLLQYYSNAEQELLKTRSFDLKKALDDPEFYSELQDLLESVRHLPAGSSK